MCAIGGVKLSGGEGKFSGAFFGILIYFIINTIFTYLPSGISVHWQSIIMIQKNALRGSHRLRAP